MAVTSMYFPSGLSCSRSWRIDGPSYALDPAVALLAVALLGLAAGGVYQQRFCADVDFRAPRTKLKVLASGAS